MTVRSYGRNDTMRLVSRLSGAFKLVRRRGLVSTVAMLPITTGMLDRTTRCDLDTGYRDIPGIVPHLFTTGRVINTDRGQIREKSKIVDCVLGRS